MIKAVRNHRAYWAFIGHRLSGVLLALFLPFHFLMLGLALEGAATMDYFIKFSELALVKFAEWGLLTLLSLHLFFGARLLVLEFFPWRQGDDARLHWIPWGLLASIVIGAIFVIEVV